MIDDLEWAQLIEILRELRLERVLGKHRDAVTARLLGVERVIHARTPGYEFSVPGLLAEYKRNPHRVAALLEALAFNCSSEMLAMLWLVVQGATVVEISYQFKHRESAALVISVALDPDHIVSFSSTDHWDLAVLRLAGISKSNGLPVIESFYAFAR